ncbi:hypothetical protein [Pantoea piersonii]|uniref:hypothetical protein n=1 Tax=Pantoea piersonii TaxID=2364647 RepID=UPI0028ADF7F6|nr:hypothetical protein [Pantoea piersonii]
MKKLIRSLLALTMVFSFSSMAAFYECEINNGTVGFCGSWAQAQGYPVQGQDGTYHDCDINNGSVGFCGSWSQQQGFPVKQSDGSYYACDINNGSVSFCGAWYQGKAYVEK